MVEDIDEAALSYAEIKALAAGNPLIKEKMTLDAEVSKLQLQKQGYLDQIYQMKSNLVRKYPNRIKFLSLTIDRVKSDLQHIKEATPESFYTDGVFPGMMINGVAYVDKKEADNALIKACGPAVKSLDVMPVGEYRGLPIGARFDFITNQYILQIGFDLKA